jgi:hypothetical protein
MMNINFLNNKVGSKLKKHVRQKPCQMVQKSTIFFTYMLMPYHFNIMLIMENFVYD